jgi:hypothetical protein
MRESQEKKQHHLSLTYRLHDEQKRASITTSKNHYLSTGKGTGHDDRDMGFLMGHDGIDKEPFLPFMTIS